MNPRTLRRTSASALILIAVLLSGAPARSTTYLAMTDTDLLDQTPLVVEITVQSAGPGIDTDLPVTDYVASVDRVLKGSLDETSIVVRVIGGEEPGGAHLHVEGAPQLAEGDTAITFLSPIARGVYEPMQLGLGVFQRVETNGGDVALRNLGEAVEVHGRDESTARLRAYERFATWITDRASGKGATAEYLLEGSTRTVPRYRLSTAGGKYERWFSFDEGRTVPWYINPARTLDLGRDQRAFLTGMDAWNQDQATNIRYGLAGTSGSRSGFLQSDGWNTLLFGDPNGEIAGSSDCIRGGVLAVGGAWTHGAQTWNGESYARIVESEIITQDGIECFLRTPSNGAELFAHELGHTLGLKHSCGDVAPKVRCAIPAEDEAIMRSWAHEDGRGARLSSDDRAAIARLYRGSGVSSNPGPLPAPTNLRATALSRTQIRLEWADNSTGESEFAIEISMGRRFRPAGRVAANTIRVQGTAAPGSTLWFRVRAQRGRESSAWSNIAVVRMPR